MATEKRTPAEPKTNSGIYLGRVVNHLDTRYMGALEVELMKKRDSANVGQYIQCKYASPFFGTTSYNGLGRGSDYKSTQKSYGFWAVPPDVGTIVIVVMPEGDYSQAYWIGCVPEPGMNFMTPGYAATTFSDAGQAAQVGEYNKKTTPNVGKDPTKIVKPHDPDAFQRLGNRGLKQDYVRGFNTSSARREAPSQVYGWSTPGPVDRNGPKHKYGKEDTQIDAPFNRLGGHSFVMDDGDMSLLRKTKATEDKIEYASDGDPKLPANDLTRIQTRNGHQILLHNTEDLIYIAHGSGKSWIEMTGNGKIDLYAEDSISIHSENDLNFTADRDINLWAKKELNIRSDEDSKVYSGGKLSLETVDNLNMVIGANTYWKNKARIFVDADMKIQVTSQEQLDIETKNWIQMKSLQLKVDTRGSIELHSEQFFDTTAPYVNMQTAITNIIGPGGVNLNGGGSSKAKPIPAYEEMPKEYEAPDEYFTKPARIPTHEPWSDHENNNPQTFVPDETRAIKVTEHGGNYDNGKAADPLPPAFLMPDTFNKPT